MGEWRPAKDASTGAPVSWPFHYLSPDGTTFLAVGGDFTTGAMNWGVKGADVLRTFSLAAAVPGKPFYLTSEADVMTWRGALGADGNFTNFAPFVQQGGEGVAVDAGQRLRRRRTHLVFGGADRRTLFIAARTSLYAVRTCIPASR